MSSKNSKSKPPAKKAPEPTIKTSNNVEIKNVAQKNVAEVNVKVKDVKIDKFAVNAAISQSNNVSADYIGDIG